MSPLSLITSDLDNLLSKFQMTFYFIKCLKMLENASAADLILAKHYKFMVLISVKLTTRTPTRLLDSFLTTPPPPWVGVEPRAI